jgi:hypothetical protein
MLYKDIKQELERIIPLIGFYSSKISDDTLSLLLGQAASHISKKHYSRTEIAEDLLYGYEISLKSKFSLWEKEAIDNTHQLLLIKADDKISKFIQKYRIYNQIYFGNDFIFMVNSLKRYTHGKSSYEHHPNLKVNYFEKIDTKEKAYWLGWLFAEAWLSQHPQQKNSYEIGVGCKVADIRLLYKFANAIGFNIKFKQIKNYIDKNNNEKDFISIRFLNKEFAYWLQSRGFITGSSKSGNINLPKLNSRELYLSFLLGFFDGDGIQGSSEIRCGSRKFFEQVKDLFGIDNLITEKTSERINFNGRIIKGKTYGLFLGADLFNEMLDNYQTSLPRKRIYFTGKQERLEQLSRARDVAKKFRVSPKEFEILLWLMPMKDIAELLDISYGRVCEYKKRWENEGLIKTPPYGYWNRKVTLRVYLINNILSNYDINSPYYNNYK